MASPPSVDSLLEGFPHTTVPPILGQPSYETITNVLRLLNSNAASVQSELGGGQLGHLGLTVSPAVYATLSADPFVVPPNPGPTGTVPAHATAPQITETHRAHQELLRIWRKANNVDMAIKHQLIAAVEPMFLRAIMHRHTGFASVTTRALIVHLMTSYGQITPTELAANDIRYRAAYDPSQPIELLFGQIEDAMDYADAGGSPYSAAQVITNAYALVFNTGMMPESCREWRRRTEAEKTWGNFKLAFAEAHQDLRQVQATTQGAGYHGANAAMESFAHETADAFANLATATAADRHILAELTAANTALTSQLAAKEAELAQLRNAAPPRSGGRQSNRSNTHRTPNTNYCWTHGYKVGRNHTSATCMHPNEGHMPYATSNDTKGGSTLGKE